jgi:hypothetical protein
MERIAEKVQEFKEFERKLFETMCSSRRKALFRAALTR